MSDQSTRTVMMNRASMAVIPEPDEVAPAQNARTIMMSRVQVLALANQLDKPAPVVPPLSEPTLEPEVTVTAARDRSPLLQLIEGVLIGLVAAVSCAGMLGLFALIAALMARLSAAV